MDFDDFGFASQQTPQPEAPSPSEQRAAPVAMQSMPMRPMAGPATTPFAARAKAGFGLIAAAAGAGAGAVLAGPGGAAVGLIGVGALRNLYRAQGLSSPDPEVKHDAARAVALFLVGGALAGYLGYKIFSSNKDSEE
jgi:hypothetical protein